MAIVETSLSDCYHNLIFDKFLQLGYQIPVTIIILLYMQSVKNSSAFQIYRLPHQRCLKIKWTDSSENGKHKLFVS